MSEPVSPPLSAAPEHTRTASAQSKATDTVTGSPSAAYPIGPAFGPPAAEGEVGTLGPYRIVKELGKGGMGAVYLATDTRLKRKIALKVMLPEFAANASAKERFLREAQAAAQITHDNVVTVFEADVRDGVPYIAMQFLEGLPLDAFLKKKSRLTATQILRIAREAALGLSAAHKIDFVHRDIKPANLWLEAPGGRVKVLDFGLARPVHAEHELTQTGAVLGTPAYMSPEQARGLKVDHRTDLFSLGAVMYRLCTGELPFQGPTTMSVLMALGTEEPTAVRERNPEIPEPVAALVHQLLSKKPEDRPQTADELVKRIRAVAEALTAPAQTSTPSLSLPQVVAIPVPVAPQPENSAFAELDVTEAEPAEEAPKPVRKKSGKGVWIGAGFAALLALAATVVIIIKNKDGTETKIEVPDGATVTVKGKDGKVIAQVPPAGKQPPATADADRKAAEWVLSIGGGVAVIGGGQELKAVAELPKSDFSIARVNLAGNKAVTDTGLVNLKDCKNLASLSLELTVVTDAGLAHLKDCKNLTHLNLGATGVTDAGLVNLEGCKNLMLLVLSGTGVTDVGLTYFKDRKDLMHIWLHDTKVTDAGLAHLKDCKNLKELYVKGTKVTAKGLEEFQTAVPGCKIDHDGGVIEPKVSDDVDRKAAEWVLSIGGVVYVNGENRELKATTELPKEPFALTGVNLRANQTVTDAGLAHLKECKGLTYLHLAGTAITDVGLAHPKECKGLTYLHLAGTGVTDAGLAHLKNRNNLSYLSLSGTKVTDAGLAHLKDCNNLTNLGLSNTGATDAGLAHFKDCKGLKALNVKGTKITANGLEEFHAAVPGCKIEHDGGVIEPKVSDDRKAAEWVLSIGGKVQVNDGEKEIKAATELRKDPFALTGVNLADNKAVTDAGLTQLKDCKKLTSLGLPGTGVTDVGLAHLKDCKNLTQLNVGRTSVTDAGLGHFKDCKNLTNLNLSQTKVTDAGLTHFKDCKNLTELRLDGAVMVTDAGLAHFKDCNNLTQLHLSRTGVTDKGLEYFKDCNNLTSLSVPGTGVTDAGLAHLKDCKNVSSLNLSLTKVTDAGLAHFKDCKSLTELKVKGTKMTAKGLEEFQTAVPDCKIEHDGGVIEPKK